MIGHVWVIIVWRVQCYCPDQEVIGAELLRLFSCRSLEDVSEEIRGDRFLTCTDSDSCPKGGRGQCIDVSILRRRPRESRASRLMQSRGKCRFVILLGISTKVWFSFADGKEKRPDGLM